MRTVN